MAFTVTINRTTKQGDAYVVYGKYVNDGGSTGGNVVTGLTKVDDFHIQPSGAAVIATQSVINATLPLASGTVAIVTSANETGYFKAEGK